MNVERNNRTPLLLLAICCALPSFQTLVAVYWEWHTPVTYPLLKAVMILLPVIVWLRLRRRGVSIRQRAGLSRGAVYHYFRSQDDIIAALRDRSPAEYERLMEVA